MHTETMAEWLGQGYDGLWEVIVYPHKEDPYVETFFHMWEAEQFLYQFREVSPYHG